MTKPRRRSEARLVRRIVHVLELRQRRRDQRLRAEILDAVAKLLAMHDDSAYTAPDQPQHRDRGETR